MKRPNFGANRSLWLGLVGILVIAVIVVGSSLFAVAGFGQKAVEVEFDQAAGLKSGDKVRVAGIDVGTIGSAKIENDYVVMSLKINKDVDLGADAGADIKMASILGARYINLRPGDGKGLPGNRIPRINTTVPFNLGKIVQDPTYCSDTSKGCGSQFDHLADIDTDEVARALNLLNEQLGSSPKQAAAAIDSFGALAKVVAARRDEVDQMLKNLDQVSTVLSDNRNSILMVMTQGEAIARAIRDRQALITRLLDDVASLMRLFDEIGADNGGQVGPLINTLNTVASGLEKNKANLDRLFETLPVTARGVANATADGPFVNLYIPWLFPDNWACFADQFAPVIIEGECR